MIEDLEYAYAFPVAGLSGLPNGDFIQPYGGMSFRAWAATKILAGMLAADGNTGPRWSPLATGPDTQPGGGKWLDPNGVTRQAVEIADALIAQLKKSPEEITRPDPEE